MKRPALTAATALSITLASLTLSACSDSTDNSAGTDPTSPSSIETSTEETSPEEDASTHVGIDPITEDPNSGPTESAAIREERSIEPDNGGLDVQPLTPTEQERFGTNASDRLLYGGSPTLIMDERDVDMTGVSVTCGVDLEGNFYIHGGLADQDYPFFDVWFQGPPNGDWAGAAAGDTDGNMLMTDLEATSAMVLRNGDIFYVDGWAYPEGGEEPENFRFAARCPSDELVSKGLDGNK